MDGDAERLTTTVEECDAVIAENRDSPDPVAQRRFSEALYRRGQALRKLERHVEAIASFRELVALADAQPETSERTDRRAIVAVTLSAAILAQLERWTEALDAADDALARIDHRGEMDDRLATLAAGACELRRIALHQLDRRADSRAVNAEIIERFGGSADPRLRVQVAQALVRRLGRQLDEDALPAIVATSQALAARVATEPDASLERVGEVTLGAVRRLLYVPPNSRTSMVRVVMRATLATQRRTQGWWRARLALDVCRALHSRLDGQQDPALQRLDALARFAEASALFQLGRFRECVSAVENVIGSEHGGTVPALGALVEEMRGRNDAFARLGTVSILNQRAVALGMGDPKIARLAYDDSVAERPDLTRSRSLSWTARLLRPKRPSRFGRAARAVSRRDRG